MFLDELNCDKAKYINNAKELVENYIASFFDVKFTPVIKERLNQTSLLFIKRSQVHIDASFNFIKYEKRWLTIEWFKKLNLPFVKKVDYLDEFVGDNIILIRNYLKPSKRNVDIIKDKLDKIGENNIEVNKTFVKSLIKNYKTNLYEDLKKLDDLQIKILLDETKSDFFTDFKDVLLDKVGEESVNKMNLYSQQLFVLILLNKFAKDDGTGGLFVNKEYKNIGTNLCIYDTPIRLSTLTFVHEIMHAVSYDYFSLKNIFKYGIEYANDINRDGDCKYLNEILTEYFAFKITNKLLKDNIAPFYKDTNKTSYSKCFVLVEPFFKKYEEKLKHFYLYYSPENLYKYFGIENLRKIDDLLLTFSSIYKNVKLQYKVYDYDTCLKFSKEKLDNLGVVDKKYFDCFKQMEQVILDIDANVKKLGREEECTF